MRENKPVLLVLSAYDGKLFLRKGKFYGSYTLLMMPTRLRSSDIFPCEKNFSAFLTRHGEHVDATTEILPDHTSCVY